MTLFDIRPKKDYARLKENLAKPRPPLQHSGEWSHLLKNGDIIIVEISSYLFEDKGKKLALVVVNDITERKRAEESLKKSELQYHTLAQMSPVGIFRTDATGFTTYVNPRWCQISGLSADEALGDGWLKAVHPDDRKKLRVGWKKATHSRQGSAAEYRFIRPDGTIAWVMGQAVPEKNLENKIVGYVGTITDITDRKRIEETLKKSEDNFRNLVENINDVFYVSDAQGKLLYCSPNFFTSTGFSPAETLGKSYIRMIMPDDRRKVVDHYLKETNKGVLDTKLEFRVLRKKKSPIWTEQNTRIVRDNNGKVVQYRNVVRDITERKQAEELLKKSEQTLRQSEERYRSLFDRMMDGFYRSTHEGKFVEVNPAMVQMFGFSGKEEMLNLDIKKELYFAPSERDSLFMDTGKERIETFRMRRKDGTEIWVEDHGRYVHDEKGNVIFHEGILRDVTHRIIAEATLKKSEEKYRDIFAWAPVGIYQSSTDGEILTANQSLADILGYDSPEALLNCKFGDDIYYNEQERQKLIKESDKGGGNITNLEVLWKKKDGTPIWVMLSSHSIKDASDKTIYIEGFVTDINERKRAQIALHESERKLSTLMSNLPGMAYRCKNDRDWTMNYISQGCIELTGYQPEELIDNNKLSFNDLIDENYREHLWNKWKQVLKNREVFQDEYPIRTAAGKQKWVWEQGCGIYSETGEVIALEGLIIDITERKRAEEAMLKLSKAVESSGEVIFMTDPNGIFTYVNPEFTKLYGYQPDVVIGKSTPRILKSGTMSQEEYEIFWQTLLEKQVIKSEFINKSKDGKLINVEVAVNPVTDEKQNIIGFLAIQKDITERKKAEEALKLQTTYLSQLFENSPTGIAFIDTNDCVMNVNKAFENMFQYSLEEIKGKSLTYLIVPDELRKESLILSNKVIGGELIRISSVRKRKDGSQLDMIITGFPIIIEGKCVGIYAIYADVSDIKKLEDQIRQTQKLESIGTLAGGIAHDFNNILGIILGYTSLLEDGAANPAKIKLSMDAITKAVHRGAGLVKQILTFARKTNIVIAPVNVNDSIQEIKKMLYETFPKTILLSSDLDENIQSIIADHNQIHQALLNLSVNARDAILLNAPDGHGGIIKYSTKIVSGKELQKKFTDATDENYVCICVADNGSGIDAETVNRIFEPFFTTKEQGKGTGLGLSVVYGIVKSHRGFIDVQSELGVGTTFYLYFPCEVQKTFHENVETDIQVPISGGNETILFVEDEEMLQEVVKAQLTLKGYRVLSAYNGEDAVEMYRQHQNEIAVVLSDLGLPKLGGFEAFLRMKKINPNAKIVLASGFFDPAQKSRMLEAGVEYFIQKPYRANEILTAIRKLLDKK